MGICAIPELCVCTILELYVHMMGILIGITEYFIFHNEQTQLWNLILEFLVQPLGIFWDYPYIKYIHIQFPLVAAV